MTGPVPPTEAIFISTPSPRLTEAVPHPVIVPELPVASETTADESDPFFSIVSVGIFPSELAVRTLKDSSCPGSRCRHKVNDASDDGFSGRARTGRIASPRLSFRWRKHHGSTTRKHYRLRIGAVPFYPGGLKCFLCSKIYGGLRRSESISCLNRPKRNC